MTSIIYRKGDLIAAALAGEVTIIAHQCNCSNAMRKGIAPQIAKAFPLAKQADQATTRGDRKKMGTFSHASQHGVEVYNLYGQFGWWRQIEGKINTDYDALSAALSKMASHIPKTGSIGLRKLGCGHGGGKWEVVEQLILAAFSESDLPIIVYEY